MPQLTESDFTNAIAFGNAIDGLEKSEDEMQPLPPSSLDWVRHWLDNDPNRLGDILRAAAIFTDEEMGDLLSCIYEKSNTTSAEWASVAQVLFDEYMGGQAGPECTGILFG